MTIAKIVGSPKRIPLLGAEGLTPEQRCVYDKVVSGPRGVVVGPLRAALHSPELASRWSDLGEQLRYRTSLLERQSELAIIMVARHWNSDTEWAIHSEIAKNAGVSDETIQSIRIAEPPQFDDPVEALIYEFTRQLLSIGQVSDEVYCGLYGLFDEVWIVELTALIGYYTMVAMSLNAHHIPIPANTGPGLLKIGAGAPAVTLLPPLPGSLLPAGPVPSRVLDPARSQLP